MNHNLEINVMRARQGEMEFYIGGIPADILCGEWGENHIVPDRYDPVSDEGYQRNITPARAKDFARYLMGGRASPTSIRLNIRDLNSTFKPFPNTVDYGRLEIPANTMLYVVDGQHRLEGLKTAYQEKVDKKEKWNFDFPVIFTQLSKYEEAVDFAVINKTQKGLKTDLTDRVLRKIADNESPFKRMSLPKNIRRDIQWRATATLISDYLDEHASVWKGRVIKPNAERTENSAVTETTLVASLEPVINAFDVTDVDVDRVGEVLENYWSAIKDLCPESVNQPKNSVLMKTLGTSVMHKLLIDIIEISDNYHEGNRSSQTFKEILENAGEYLQDQFWKTAGVYGSGKGSVSNVYRMVKEAILSVYYEKQENRVRRSL